MSAVCDLDDFLPDIRTYAPHASDPISFRFLREAARELCDRVAIWYDNDVIEITEVTGCEGICTVVDAEIVNIQRADINGHILEPKTLHWLDEYRPEWEIEQGVSRYVTQLAANHVRVVPKEAGTLKLRLVLKPSLDATTVPEILFTNYKTAIARGAAGLLLMSPQNDTANPNLGQALYTEFKDEIGRLAINAVRTQFGAPLRTRGQYF